VESTPTVSSPTGRRARGLALLLMCAVVAGACAGPERDVREGLPAEWRDSVRPAEPMALRLERDGTAWLENVPLWDGSGSCEGAGPVRYTGTATWTWERGFLLDPGPRGARCCGTRPAPR